MTNEEKKAVEKLRNISKQCHNSKECWENENCPDCYVEVEDIMTIDTVLKILKKQDNRIKKLEADNYECNNIIREYIEDWELKNKIIELMAEHLTTPIHSKKDVIDYFENLAKESGEIDEDESN